MPFWIIKKLIGFAWKRWGRRPTNSHPRSNQRQGDGVLARRALQLLILLSPLLAYHLWWLFLILGFWIGIRLARRSEDTFTGKGTHGTARWAWRSELETAGMCEDRGGLLVGRLRPRPPLLLPAFRDLFSAPLEESQGVVTRFWRALFAVATPGPLLYLSRFVNVVTVAPPGAGKGAGMVIPNLLRYRGSVVVIDPKGENYKATAQHRARKFGHRIVLFDPFRATGGPGSPFNLLSGLEASSPTVVEECQALAEAVVVRSGQEHDPTWNDNACVAISAFMLYVVCYAPPEERNLNTVADLLFDPQEFQAAIAVMRDQKGKLASTLGRTHTYQSLRRFGNSMSSWVDRELASIQATVNRHLAFTNGPLVRESIGSSEIDLRDLARAKVSLYLVLPTDMLESQSRLMRLWLTACFRALVRNGLQEKHPVLFVLDEVGNLGQMKPLREAVTMLRGYGARMWFIFQALTQMKELFGENWNTVWSGIDQKVFFGIRDTETATELSKLIGETTVQSLSESNTNRPASGPAGAFGFGTSDTTVVRAETKRSLVMPEEILRTDARTLFVIPSDVPPTKAAQVRYYEEPELFDSADAVADEDESGEGGGGLTAAPIYFRHQCGKRYRLPSGMAGKRAKCVLCKRSLVVPGGSILPK